MNDSTIHICASDELTDGGNGIRFPVTAGGQDSTGFVVRYGGVAYAYLNRCAHVPIELDWNHGEFFEGSGLYLLCSTHGAIYLPQNGRCAGGPCRGGSLRMIMIFEHDNQLFWQPDEYIKPAMA